MSDSSEQEFQIDSREIVGVPEHHQGIRDYVKGLSEKTKSILERIAVPDQEVDPKILEFANDLHDLNQKRARDQGQEYTQPQILYLDKQAIINDPENIKMFNNSGLGNIGDISASLLELPNTVIVYVNSFSDKDIDSYWTA